MKKKIFPENLDVLPDAFTDLKLRCHSERSEEPEEACIIGDIFGFFTAFRMTQQLGIVTPAWQIKALKSIG